MNPMNDNDSVLIERTMAISDYINNPNILVRPTHA